VNSLPILILLGSVACFCAGGQTNIIPANGTSVRSVETIVCIRHGEKPQGGLGQLTCRGLNRALALPEVLLAKYGEPQFVFAPNPTQKIEGNGVYFYIRPLMTIEPTAVRFGLPVNTQFAYQEIKGLEKELQKKQYQNATVFVAWEHVFLDAFAKNLVLTNGGSPEQVPPWEENDYDTIFLVRVTHSGAHKSVAFSIAHEGLDHLSDTCPAIPKEN
jgi:hypothetical protein